MGSQFDLDHQLLPITSPDLILTHPTPSERRAIWTLTHPKWGTALTLDDYLHREAYLMTVPLARRDGIAQWILTDGRLPPDARPILSSCETLRKRAFIVEEEEKDGDQEVREAIAHGIGSVFTDPQFRGRGYASLLMEMVGKKLKTHHGREMMTTTTCSSYGGSNNTNINGSPSVAFSVLYSDIGKNFYARHGWAAHPSRHLSFTPRQKSRSTSQTPARPIGYHELAELCAIDENLLKEKMTIFSSSSSHKTTTQRSTTRVALAPDLDAMLWHLMREDFVTSRLFGPNKTPTVRGSVFGEAGRRVWAVWTRSYTARPPRREGNTLHVLRLVVEDAALDTGYLAEAVGAVLDVARHEAAEWQTARVELWNPSRELEELLKGAELEYEAVEREVESIPSLMWYGAGSGEDIDWVANEKYAWY